MLPSSVRRIVSTAPQSPVVASLASPVPRAGCAFGLSYRPNGHQRRYSSSKPSRTDNGSKEFSARQSPPSSSSSDQPSKKSESKSAGEKRKRKAKDAAAEARPLPSVPSTQHIPPEAFGLSTFFSLYRPISITHSFPKAITEEKFAEIFTLRNKSPKAASEVMSTLSQTVHDLEQPLSKLQLEEAGRDLDAHNADGAADGMTRLELRHADGTETSVYLQLNAMAGQFLPYRPPPLPQPQTADGESTAAATGVSSSSPSEDAAARAEGEDDAEDALPRMRTYKAILTIEETVDAAGHYKVVAHSPELVEEGSLPRTFLERMALRQAHYEDARRRVAVEGRMVALSVRRQRKLKMKKKKYKKLMRRTRNERRKLQRT